MRYFKAVRYDVGRSMLKRAGYWAVPVSFAVLACCWLLLDIRSLWGAPSGGQVRMEVSLLDALLYVHSGIKEYIPDGMLSFTFPVAWLLVYILPCFLAMRYFHNDVTQHGLQVLTRSYSRAVWWRAKCIWAFLFCCGYFVLLNGAVLLFSLPAGWRLGGGLNVELAETLYAVQLPDGMDLWGLLVYLLVMPVLVAFACCMLQMAVALYVKAFFGYLAGAALLVASAYAMHPLLVGNYGMAVRSRYVLEGGGSMPFGMAVCAVMAALAFAAGALRLKRFDFMSPSLAT